MPSTAMSGVGSYKAGAGLHGDSLAGATSAQPHKGRRGSGRKQRGGRRGEVQLGPDEPLERALAAADDLVLPLGPVSAGWKGRATQIAQPFQDWSSSGLSEDSKAALKHMEALLSAADHSPEKDKLTDKDRLGLYQAMRGHAANLAFDASGCRLLQRTLELIDAEQQVEIVNELKGLVAKAVDSAHGNHVLQRVIELLKPTDVMFIVHELKESQSASKLAEHRYGCRVLERLIEHFPMEKLAEFLDDVISATEMTRFKDSLMMNPFGNFVIQHVLEHGNEEPKRRIVAVLLDNLKEAANDPHACSVLDKALSYTSFQEQIAEQILGTVGLLAEMATQRGGCAATQRLFLVCNDSALLQAKQQISVVVQELLLTKHGRALLQTVAPEFVPPGEPSASSARARASTLGNSPTGQSNSRKNQARWHGISGRSQC